jgi:hypothetical protein
MDKKEIIEKELELLEELQKLEDERPDPPGRNYDLRSLTDPRELSGLRNLTNPFSFRPKSGR